MGMYELKAYVDDEMMKDIMKQTGEKEPLSALRKLFNNLKNNPVVYIDKFPKITDYGVLIDTVENDYLNFCNETEFNSLFVDYQVYMSKRDIIAAYAKIQEHINGDTVFRFNKDGIYDRKNPKVYEPGFIKDGEFEDYYEGSAKNFLESLNDKKIFGRIAEGELVDFII